MFPFTFQLFIFKSVHNPSIRFIRNNIFLNLHVVFPNYTFLVSFNNTVISYNLNRHTQTPEVLLNQLVNNNFLKKKLICYMKTEKN